jgi:3-keto-5-aminohexanoate cleavage enzyme
LRDRFAFASCDNIKIDRNRLAKSNAELVSCVTEVCAEFDRNAARPAEARALLGLPAA